MNADVRQKWRARIRAWQSVEPMPITEAEEAELHDAFGFAYASEKDLHVFWFGDPHFGQRFRIAEEKTTP
jgi:hypothetical protein